MQRITVSLDDELAEQFDRLIAHKGYTNRSKAIRDLLIDRLAHHAVADNPEVECVAVVSYVYDHHVRQLAMRLTEHQHHHSDCVISTMHVHISPSECAETVVIRGPYQRVKELAEGLIAEPGIRHGDVNIMPIGETRPASHTFHPNDASHEALPETEDSTSDEALEHAHDHHWHEHGHEDFD